MRYKKLFPVWLGFEICTNNGDFISKIKCLLSLGMDLAFYEHSRGRLSFLILIFKVIIALFFLIIGWIESLRSTMGGMGMGGSINSPGT